MNTIRYGTNEFFDYIGIQKTALAETPYRIAIHRLEGDLCAYMTREQVIELRAALADVLLEDEEQEVKEKQEEITL